MEDNSKKQKISGLLSLLSNEATADSRKLLKQKGLPDAKNHKDLEFKLAELYRNSDDKKDIEKCFCEIHPHRSFILKYTVPETKPESKIEAPNGAVLTEEGVKDILRQYIGEPKENFSNCAGNPNCNCGMSSFNGYSNAIGMQKQNNDTTMIAVTVIGVIAIIGLLAYYKKH